MIFKHSSSKILILAMFLTGVSLLFCKTDAGILKQSKKSAHRHKENQKTKIADLEHIDVPHITSEQAQNKEEGVDDFINNMFSYVDKNFKEELQEFVPTIDFKTATDISRSLIQIHKTTEGTPTTIDKKISSLENSTEYSSISFGINVKTLHMHHKERKDDSFNPGNVSKTNSHSSFNDPLDTVNNSKVEESNESTQYTLQRSLKVGVTRNKLHSEKKYTNTNTMQSQNVGQRYSNKNLRFDERTKKPWALEYKEYNLKIIPDKSRPFNLRAPQTDLRTTSTNQDELAGQRNNNNALFDPQNSSQLIKIPTEKVYENHTNKRTKNGSLEFGYTYVEVKGKIEGSNVLDNQVFYVTERQTEKPEGQISSASSPVVGYLLLILIICLISLGVYFFIQDYCDRGCKHLKVYCTTYKKEHGGQIKKYQQLKFKAKKGVSIVINSPKKASPRVLTKEHRKVRFEENGPDIKTGKYGIFIPNKKLRLKPKDSMEVYRERFVGKKLQNAIVPEDSKEVLEDSATGFHIDSLTADNVKYILEDSGASSDCLGQDVPDLITLIGAVDIPLEDIPPRESKLKLVQKILTLGIPPNASKFKLDHDRYAKMVHKIDEKGKKHKLDYMEYEMQRDISEKLFPAKKVKSFHAE